MLKPKYFILLLFFFISSTLADIPANDQSIKELLEVTKVRKLVDDMAGNMDRLMKNSIQQSLRGQSVTPEQQKIIEDMEKKTIAILREELVWTKLEPLYLQVYRESFSQEEVDGMLAFYKTPAGQAVINKMPLVMQKASAEMQKRMSPVIQKVQQIQQETANKLNATTKQPKQKKK